MATQTELNISDPVDSVETYEFEPIQGELILHWTGKRPFRSTQYYPTQLKETYGKEVDDWLNKIYWGDNLQVMSHLLKTYRGRIALIYIDPPFDSKVDYKKRIQLKGKTVENDHGIFEEKQYTDIWTNDEYLQFMYERLLLLRELLSEDGSIYLHCDWRKNSYMRLVLDEVFGRDQFKNEVVWQRDAVGKGAKKTSKQWSRELDTIFWYAKSEGCVFNQQFKQSDELTHTQLKEFRYKDADDRLFKIVTLGDYSQKSIDEMKQRNLIHTTSTGKEYKKYYLDEFQLAIGSLWNDIPNISHGKNPEVVGYPTQKPERLLERIIRASSNPGDIVFDCFMGSGTTQAVAMKLGRRFIGADINLGAIETTTKRLINVAAEIQTDVGQEKIKLEVEGAEDTQTFYTGFEVYNVNNYEVFRNPVEAKDLLIEALEIQPLQSGGIYDGEKDGCMVKIMPVNRIATRADLNELIAGFDYQAFERRQEEHPTRPVEKLLLVCMGHEPDLAAALQNEVPYKLEIEVVDILRDKSKLEFKRESKARIARQNGHLIIKQFYPMNLLQKLSLMEENVEDWRELVESVKVDFNYDGAVLNPCEVDVPEEGELVKGSYPIPEDAGTIRVKITDLLSESLEETPE